MSPQGRHGLSGLVKYLEKYLEVVTYPNCIYITIRACSTILAAKRSIAHICDSIDIKATTETVIEITKLSRRSLGRGYNST